MRCIVLGCGGSFGVPQIGCNCRVCISKNKKNHRSRASIYLESLKTGASILVDASTDLRNQALQNNIAKLDAVIFTHKHADHTAGIDDLKPFAYSFKNRFTAENPNPLPYTQILDKLPIYMTHETYSAISYTYAYLFNSHSKLYRPLLTYNEVESGGELNLSDLKIEFFPQTHGEITSLGLIINDKFAYMTDFNSVSNEVLQTLRMKDLNTIIIDCLKYSVAPSHCWYEKTLYYIEQIAPKKAYITHCSHEVEYDEFNSIMPKNIELAYDGLIIEHR